MSGLVTVIGTKVEVVNTTIANGATDSAEVNLNGKTLCGVYIPSGFTGTAISFKSASAKNGTFLVVKDGAGNTLSKTCAASQYIYLDPSNFAGIENIIVVSNASESGGDTLGLAVRVL